LIAAPGFIEPVSETVAISASAFGRLRAVKVEEGDRVTAGEVIAEIENDDLRAQLDAAQAELKQREDELARLQAGAREQERREAEDALREADVAVWFARLEFGRQSALGDKAVSRAAVDKARAELETAEARWAALAEKVSLIEAPPRAEDLAIAQAKVDSAKAEVDAAKALLEKTYVRSPLDGVLLRRYAKAGEMMSLQPPTPIAEIGDISKLRVRAQIDEADVGRVAPGEAAWVTADAYPGRRFAGRVVRVGNIMGPKNFRTDAPGERMDTKVLEVLIDLETDIRIPIGLRVDVEFAPAAEAENELPAPPLYRMRAADCMPLDPAAGAGCSLETKLTLLAQRSPEAAANLSAALLLLR
jgi:HlyD family secretion protein